MLQPGNSDAKLIFHNISSGGFMTLPIPASNPQTTKEWVILKDGTEVEFKDYIDTTTSIKVLAKKHLLLFHELLLKCRKPEFEIPHTLPFSTISTITILQELSLMNQDGIINDSIKKIILNSVRGEGIIPDFVDPLKKV
jgi:hypothetical protein